MNNDLISRSALKEDLKQYFSDGTLDSVSAKLAFNMVLRKIDNAPTVEEKSYAMGYQDGLEDGLDGIRPQGEWIEKTDKNGLSYVCPFCGKEIAGSDLNYCVKCGANMKKGGAK